MFAFLEPRGMFNLPKIWAVASYDSRCPAGSQSWLILTCFGLGYRTTDVSATWTPKNPKQINLIVNSIVDNIRLRLTWRSHQETNSMAPKTNKNICIWWASAVGRYRETMWTDDLVFGAVHGNLWLVFLKLSISSRGRLGKHKREVLTTGHNSEMGRLYIIFSIFP